MGKGAGAGLLLALSRVASPQLRGRLKGSMTTTEAVSQSDVEADVASSIVCSFDLPGSASAAVAAILADRLGHRLRLVHATAGTPLPSFRRTLNDEAQRLRAPGAPIDVVVDSKPMAELLALEASRPATRFVVVGSGAGSGPAAGIIARRLLRLCAVPVLVMSDPSSLQTWLRGGRPLRVMVAAAFDNALPRVRQLVAMVRTVGPCDVTVVHHSSPLGERPLARESIDEFGIDARAGDALWEEFAELPGDGALRVVVSPRIERTERYLSRAVDEADPDLVVIGSHHRDGLDRLVHGSAEARVLDQAGTNVLVVPVACTAQPTPFA